MPSLQRRLDQLLARRDPAAHRRADPVELVHRFADPADRELVGLVAALLAFGNAVAIRASVGRVLAALGPSPSRTVHRLSQRALRRRLDGFAHRVYRGSDVARMLGRAGALAREHGSLGDAMASRMDDSGGDLREALARVCDELRGPRPSPGLAHLVADPRAGSACKRSLLYLRWMVRPADGVDLGLWPLSPAALVIPVDTHVHRISRNLGLTDRKTASWKTAEEITARLRAFDPRDPVKYDFAICHLGVSRDCPSRPDPAKCAECVLRPVCKQWSASRAPRPGARRERSEPRAR